MIFLEDMDGLGKLLFLVSLFYFLQMLNFLVVFANAVDRPVTTNSIIAR